MQSLHCFRMSFLHHLEHSCSSITKGFSQRNFNRLLMSSSVIVVFVLSAVLRASTSLSLKSFSVNQVLKTKEKKSVSVRQQTAEGEFSDDHQVLFEVGSECFELLLAHISLAVCAQGLFTEEAYVSGSKRRR